MFGRRPRVTHFVSYPKSGRTWLQLMVSRVYAQITGHKIDDILNYRVRKYRKKFSKRLLPGIHFSHGRENEKICLGDYFPVEFYRDQPVLLLVRDPRDVIVSHYYYGTYCFNSFSGSLSEFITYPYRNADGDARRFGIEPMVNYLNAWVEHYQSYGAFRLLYFEDLKADPRGELERVLQYVGLEATPELVEDALEYGSFENMRKLETEGAIDWYGLPGGDDPRGFKTRKGIAGGYKKELEKENIALLDNYLNANLSEQLARYRTPARATSSSSQ